MVIVGDQVVALGGRQLSSTSKTGLLDQFADPAARSLGLAGEAIRELAAIVGQQLLDLDRRILLPAIQEIPRGPINSTSLLSLTEEESPTGC